MADEPQEVTGAPVQELEIKVNLDELTFGDIEMALNFESGQVPIGEMLPFLNRVVVGGVRHIPLTAMPKIVDALVAAFAEMGNPKN